MEIDLQPLDLAETEQYLFETVIYSLEQCPTQLQFEVEDLVNAIYGATLSVGGSLESVGTKIQKELDQFNTTRLSELFGSMLGTAKLQVTQGDPVGWHVVLEANCVPPHKANQLPEFIRRELYTKYIPGFGAGQPGYKLEQALQKTLKHYIGQKPVFNEIKNAILEALNRHGFVGHITQTNIPGQILVRAQSPNPAIVPINLTITLA